MLFGLLWGFFIGAMPLPRMALTAHIQATSESMKIISLGFVVALEDVVRIKEGWKYVVLYLGPPRVWMVLITECLNSVWGAKSMLPQAAEAAKALGANNWQEIVVILGHAIGGLIFVACWGVIVHALFTAAPVDEVNKKT